MNVPASPATLPDVPCLYQIPQFSESSAPNPEIMLDRMERLNHDLRSNHCLFWRSVYLRSAPCTLDRSVRCSVSDGAGRSEGQVGSVCCWSLSREHSLYHGKRTFS